VIFDSSQPKSRQAADLQRVADLEPVRDHAVISPTATQTVRQDTGCRPQVAWLPHWLIIAFLSAVFLLSSGRKPTATRGLGEPDAENVSQPDGLGSERLADSRKARNTRR